MQVVSFWGDQKKMHGVERGNVKRALASYSEGLAEISSTNQLGPRQSTSTGKKHLALAGQVEGKEKGPTVASPGWKSPVFCDWEPLTRGAPNLIPAPGNPFKETAAHSSAACQTWNILTAEVCPGFLYPAASELRQQCYVNLRPVWYRKSSIYKRNC